MSRTTMDQYRVPVNKLRNSLDCTKISNCQKIRGVSPEQVIFRENFSKLTLLQTLFSWIGHFGEKITGVSPG